MQDRSRFSDRFGFGPEPCEAFVRYEAPVGLRNAITQIARESGLRPADVRNVVSRVLRVRPGWIDQDDEITDLYGLLASSASFDVYDIIEALYEELHRRRDALGVSYTTDPLPDHFEAEMNRYFARHCIGWQLVDGEIQIRGSEAFEQVLAQATQILATSRRLTAAGEMRQALLDLSRRPEADATGAIQHAMAALEVVARDVVGDQKGTLGELLKQHPGIVPPPLDQALEKAWGYASEQGRHLREGREPTLEETELIVGLAGVLTTYLTQKAGTHSTS